MLSQVSNSLITDAVFGNDINMKSILGMTFGAMVGSFLPGFKALEGGALKNGMGRSLFMSLAFGAPYKVDKSYGESGLYRNGGLSSFLIK